jgi:hypothetical protein
MDCDVSVKITIDLESIVWKFRVKATPSSAEPWLSVYRAPTSNATKQKRMLVCFSRMIRKSLRDRL